VSLTAEDERLLTEITQANKRELRSLESALFRDSLRLALYAYNSTQ
jgi:hypothetical protein